MWTLEDYTGTGKGYMRIMKDGRRVADVFPFAGSANDDDVEWTKSSAREIVERMNERNRATHSSLAGGGCQSKSMGIRVSRQANTRVGIGEDHAKRL